MRARHTPARKNLGYSGRWPSRYSERRMAFERGGVGDRFGVSHLHAELSDIIRPLTKLRNTWQELPHEIRCGFQRLILPVGFVQTTIRTAELGLLLTVLGQFSGQNTNGVTPL